MDAAQIITHTLEGLVFIFNTTDGTILNGFSYPYSEYNYDLWRRNMVLSTEGYLSVP